MALGRRLLAVAWIAGLAGCSGSQAAKRFATDGATDAHAADAGTPNRDASPGDDAGRPRDAALPDDAREPHDATARDAPSQSDAADAEAASPDAGVDAVPNATTLSLSVPLVPAFSTSIHDYYVRCRADVNAITVSMTAATGSTIALMQPITTPPAVQSAASLSVAAGAAIVVGVTPDGADGAGATDEYWVRCLPPVFPRMSMTLYPDAGTPTPGYYLIGNTVPQGPAACYAMIVDVNGVPVWYDQAGVSVFDVENLTPGIVSFAALEGGGSKFELLNLPAGTASNVTPSTPPLDFHELRVLPNGDYVIITDPITSGVNLTGLETFGADEDVIGCIIQEIEPSGAAVWQWDITDHLDPVKDSTYPLRYSTGTGSVVDPYHCNAIDVDASGDLLVSARNMDTVFLISKATGSIVWKMGGATYTKDATQYIAVGNDPETQFYRQHDVRFQPDGTLSMYDDQTAKPGPARAVIYSYDVSSGTASMVWEYASTVTAGDMGSFRILPDGSRTIGWGYTATPHAVFSEVTMGGQDLLDFSFDGTDWTYRAIKVPTSAFDISVLRKAVGGP